MRKRFIPLIVVFFIYLIQGGLGDFKDISEKNDTLKLSTGRSQLVKVIPVKNNIFNIKIMSPKTSDNMTLVMDDYEHVGQANLITEKNYKFENDELSLEVQKSPLQIDLSSKKGEKIFDQLNISDNEYSFSINQNDFYGLHNRSKGDLINESGGKIYAGWQGSAGSPFIWTPAGWGMIIDTRAGSLHVSDKKITYIPPKKEGEEVLNFYFIKGDPFQIYEGMAYLTGYSPMFNKYNYGFMNTEWDIDQEELYKDINKYRKLDIPIDSYILDYDWMAYGEDNYGEFRWNENKFPDAVEGTLKDSLDKLGLKLAGIRKPRIHLNTEQGEYCLENNFFHDTTTDYFTEKEVGRLDFQKEEVREWYSNNFWKHNSYEKGLVGYWNDEADKYGGPLMFMQMQRSIYKGHRENVDRRVWSINRNYFLGCQRYAYSHWSGDIETGFKSMANQRLHMLSSIALGSTWWSNDIGGFSGTPSNKNYIRWMQFGAFTPVYRVHGTWGEEREPWNYGEQATEIVRDYIKLRYSLMPYIYSEAWKNHKSGRPLVRPLVMDYPHDETVRNIFSEWHFGDNILVRPIVQEGKEKASVYLPEGKWINFHTGEKYQGSQKIESETGLEEIPIFVKSGSIIPRVKPGDYVGDPEAPQDIYYHIYPGDTSSYELYQDDGGTYDYEEGEYRLTRATQISTDKKMKFKLKKIKDGYNPKEQSKYLIFQNVEKKPEMLTLNDKKLEEKTNISSEDISQGWTYNGTQLKVKINKEEEEFIVEVEK